MSLALIGSVQEDPRISDQFRCRLAPGVVQLLREAGENGSEVRLVLDLLPTHRGFGGGVAEAEVIRASTPIASWNLPTESVELDLDEGTLLAGMPERSYPADWEALNGDYRLRPLLLVKATSDEADVRAEGPEVPVSLLADTAERVELSLDEVVRGEPSAEEMVAAPGVLEVMYESQLLSQHNDYAMVGDEDMHRAHVVLPLGYHDLKHERRTWPVIYMIPGRAGAEEVAGTLAKLAAEPAMKSILPQAIWVVLEKDTPHGHHFFLDSSLNGPRGSALVEEFVPWIDIRFRTIPESDARILVGEDQGGFAALHLLAEHPDVFADAWAISPEAIALEALGTINLYGDASVFDQPDGTRNPALRTSLGSERELIHLDVRGEVMRSRALDRGGDRWHELCAAFGGSPSTDRAKWWPFEPDTGRPRPIQVSKWAQNDLARRARMDPALARRLNEHARILVGNRDESYRNLGARALEEAVRSSLEDGVELRPWVTEMAASNSVEAGMIATMLRNEQIMELLRDRGHHE